MRRDRDMDMIRQLMLAIEAGKASFERETTTIEVAEAIGRDPDGYAPTQEEANKVDLHLGMLANAGFVEFEHETGHWLVREITWKGYDFLDSVRDPAVWTATKEGVKKAGGFSVDLMVALAKGFVKKRVEDATGIELDI